MKKCLPWIISLVVFITIFDISEGQASDEISLSYSGSALYSNYSELVVSSGRAYCASPFGVVVLDVSDPSVPRFASKVYLPFTEGITVAGNYAYVTRGFNGLSIIDVSDPDNPAITGNSPTRGFAEAVEVLGNYAYVADGDSGLSILDVSNPSTPIVIAELSFPGYAHDVSVQGPYAYLATHWEGFCVVDISKPGAPILLSQSSFMAWSVKVRGTQLFLSGEWGSGAQVWDVGNPASPQFVSWLCHGACLAHDIEGNLAFVADSDKGIHVVDITDPQHPYEASVLASPGNRGVFVNVTCSNGLVYALDERYGLVIFEAANPQFPTVVGQLVAGVDFSITLTGDRAYLCQAAGGLRTVNITDRANPTPLKRVATPDWAYHSALQGNVLYVACSFGGLQIFDVSGAGAPVLIGSYATTNLAYDVIVEGNYAYLTVTNTTNFGTLLILDVTDPQNPTVVASFQTPSAAWGLYKQGSYCYVATDGLDIIDVSNPAAPFRAGFQGGLSRAKVVKVRGALALITDAYGLHMYNVNNPSQITFFSSITQSPLWDFELYYSYVFIAHDWLGLDVYDLADPANPRFVHHWSFPGKIYDVKTDGQYIYLAAGSAFLTYRIDTPTDIPDDPVSALPSSHMLSQNYPNPFNSGTTIAYEIAGRQQVNVSVYDILGRWVKTLVDDSRSAGTYRIDWDGTDGNGRSVASGIYLYRIRTDEFHQARKMVLLK